MLYNLLHRYTSVVLLVLTVSFCCFEPPRCCAQAEQDDSGEWLKQSPEGSNAEFRMPVEPREMKRSFKPVADRPPITVKMQICSIDGGQIVFVFSYHDLHDTPVTPAKIKEVLDGAVKGSVARVIGQLIADDSVSMREYPGRKISYDFTQGEQSLKSESEIYMIGKRLYVLNVIFKTTNHDTQLSKKFFDSFNPFNPEEALATDGSVDPQPLENSNGFELPEGSMPVELK